MQQYKFTLQEKRFFKYAAMLVKIEISKEKKHQRQLSKAAKVPARIQTASLKFAVSMFVEPLAPVAKPVSTVQLIQSLKRK